ncbi:MAG: DUF2142 domain-containing protein [Armatimonadota bacterium]|nr:DUF2142 domain-containing protein [bacterium]
MKSAQSPTSRWLVAIIAVFTLLSLGYSFATKLRYGPDEPAHFIYVKSLATKLSPPPISTTETHSEDSASSHEGHQPPLYYALMAIPFALLKALGASVDTIWRVMRLLNIPIGIAWIWCVYSLGRVFFDDDKKKALAATAFVALLPTGVYQAGVISNDVLTALLFTWAIIPILSFFKTENMSIKSAALAGLLIGLAILTKAQGLVLVPAFLAAALLVWRRRNYAGTGEIARITTVAMGTAVLVSGWWFAWCWSTYGALIPHSLYNPVLPNGLTPLLFAPAATAKLMWFITSQTYGHFFIPYWLVEQHIGDWANYFYPLCVLTALILAGLVISYKRRDNVDWRALWFMLFVVAVMFAVYVRYILVVDFMAKQQGRLFLPAASVVGMVWVLGIGGWLRSARIKIAGLTAGLVLMLLCNLVIISSAIAMYH